MPTSDDGDWTPGPFDFFMFRMQASYQAKAQVFAEELATFGPIEFYEMNWAYRDFIDLVPGIGKDEWPERLKMELFNNAEELAGIAKNIGLPDLVRNIVLEYCDAVQRHTWLVFEQYKDQSDYEDWSDLIGDDE